MAYSFEKLSLLVNSIILFKSLYPDVQVQRGQKHRKKLCFYNFEIFEGYRRANLD
jgi:hypothetical protein